jgi:hypothetical protein
LGRGHVLVLVAVIGQNYASSGGYSQCGESSEWLLVQRTLEEFIFILQNLAQAALL